MNPKEEAKIIAEIINKEKQEKEIARQKRDIHARLAEDEAKKREQKLTEDFRDTGIEVFFKELVNQKVVNEAEVLPPIISVRWRGINEQGDSYSESASITLKFNIFGYDGSYNYGYDEISAIYNSSELVIKGEDEFCVGIDCSLTDATLTALRNPMQIRRCNNS